jgi:ABC-2 type transport system permease protein
MKQIKHVFLFELKSILSKKSVLVTTLVISALFFVATSIPTVISLFDNSEDTPEEPTSEETISLDDAGLYIETKELDQDALLEMLDDYTLFTSYESLKQSVQQEDIPFGFIITSPTSLKSIVMDRSLTSYYAETLMGIMQSIQIEKNLEANSLNPQEVYESMNVMIQVDEEVLGKDATNTFFLSYVLMFAVYMLVIMYGSFVSTSVAREKDNRTMEILITATKPSTLIIGKVFANGVAGLVQFGFVGLVAILGFLINQASYPSEIIDILLAGVTLDGMLVFLIFTILGYLLYLFIYASLGSLVSKIEDVSSSVTPITMLFVVAFIIGSIGLNAPDSLLVKVASFVPFTSILAMPIRYFQTSIALYELGISIVLMLLVTAFFAYFSTKIYRMGSLNYGNKIKLSQAIKMILSEKK